MSEYQYVAFLAIDRPVSEDHLPYMRRQSSRAEVTPWKFENEYHFGDFRGNAEEMLRRGYDIHLHYANFGIRTLLLRLPAGMPNPSLIKKFCIGRSLRFLKDKAGAGGILTISPFYEPDDLDECLDIAELFDRIASLRAQILEGDPRPLYLAHLAVACDANHDPDETKEAPVPAGLDKLTDAQEALAELYGLDDDLIAAAAEQSLPASERTDSGHDYPEWLRQQPESVKDGWLNALMADAGSTVRFEMLSEFQKDRKPPAWLTAVVDRTISELRSAADTIASARRQKDSDNARRQKAKRLEQMAADPAATLRETEQLAARRTTQDYRMVAELLAELREALSAKGGAAIAELQAQKLKAANPTRRQLISELRRQNFCKDN